MDYSMPGITGVETSVKLFDMFRAKGLDPANTDESPYVCCLSAYTDQPFIDKAREVGIHNYLSKPASFNSIIQLLAELGLV